MFCSKCGEKIKDGDNFCAKCGEQVERESASEQASKDAEGGKAKYRSLVLKITLGVVVVALLVGGWFGWSAYSSFRDKRKRRIRHEERLNAERANEEERQRQFEQAKRTYASVNMIRSASVRDGNVAESHLVEVDEEKLAEVVRLATPAAENGNADAQALLGDCYWKMCYPAIEAQRAEGTKWLRESEKWYRKAAESGNRYAQGRMALYCLEGFSASMDPEEAYEWARKAGVLLKNPNIQLESGRNGIVLTEEELPPSQLTIDVDRRGMSMIYGRNVTVEQIQQNVKEHFRKHRDFSCMIRADKRTELRHVRKVMVACLEGRWQAGMIRPEISLEPEISFVALYEERDRVEEIYSKLNVHVPAPDPEISQVQEEEDEPIKIEFGRSEEYVLLNRTLIRFDKLDECIKKLALNSRDVQVLLGCTEDARHGTLIRVLDICYKYKLHHINFYYGGLAEPPPEAEPPPPDEDEPPPELDTPDIEVDSPVVSPVESADVVPPFDEPVSMKPAMVDAMLNIKSTMKLKSVAGTARSAGMRGKYMTGGVYGDQATERAVLMALRWLKATQEVDGSWGTRPELGLMKGMDKAAGAGFAVLTFLAHGETPSSKEFGPTVERALNYLINSVYVVKDKYGREVKDPNGLTPYVKMRGATGSEYGFLIGTYALCEAYAMTKNPNAREAAELALARIISGQTPTGGWNYNMARITRDGPDDISFGGWAMQALKAGKMAGIHLPGMDECIKKAVNCLKTRNYSEKAGFVYRATTNHKGGGGGLAGVGCLAMQLLGYASDDKVRNALEVMKDWQPSLDAAYTCMKGGTLHNPQYYCYYATQCKYLAGMARAATPADLARWKKWNDAMKALYTKSIVTVLKKDGSPYMVKNAKGEDKKIGHWVNKDHYNYDVMGTCLAALQLMVYYRYLPTTQLKATEVEKDVDSPSKEKDEIEVEIDI